MDGHLKPCRAKVLFFGIADKLAAELQSSVSNIVDCDIFTTDSKSENEHWDLVFADIGHDMQTAVNILNQFNSAVHTPRIIFSSQLTTLEFVIPLVRKGVWTVLPAPFKISQIAEHISAWCVDHATGSPQSLPAPGSGSKDVKMVGDSKLMRQLKYDIAKASATEARILITGENGVGKELVAQAIHQQSPRADKPFIKVNCAAIPRELIESELFGYEKGAFTGALKQKKGLIAQAHTGTLFLDEIGDMAIETQVKILRVLQEHQYLPVGGHQPESFDARIITATNKNLRDEINAGRFRKDLFFRLNVIPLHVPPLRERLQDIVMLFEYFLEKNKFEKKTLLPDAVDLLRNYSWPGNVRELYNLVERISAMVRDRQIDAATLLKIQPDMAKHHIRQVDDAGPSERKTRTLRESLEAYEAKLLREVYLECGGNVSRMARKLVTDRANLHKKLKKFNIH